MRKSFDKNKFQILSFQLNLQRIGKICRELAGGSISPILIKGAAAAVNYPKPFQRAFSDIDLAVEPKSFERARQIIIENNFNIDLHRGLRHLDTLDWDNLFQNSKIVRIGETKFRSLRAEDHLRVLCVHWLNDGGADRTRLWDIYFALKNKPADFEWDRFLGVVGEKRKRWLVTVVLIVREYFGLELEKMPPEINSQNLPCWVKNEIEKEWASDHRLVPLQNVLSDRREFLRQALKRIPPNGLQAMVENEGVLRDSPGNFMRFSNVLKRLKPSVKRILKLDTES